MSWRMIGFVVVVTVRFFQVVVTTAAAAILAFLAKVTSTFYMSEVSIGWTVRFLVFWIILCLVAAVILYFFDEVYEHQ